jgi:mono/diheme cytochrome c family protein
LAAEAQEVGDAALGQTFAEQVCAECHSVTAGGQDSPRVGAPTFEVIANTRGMSATALFMFLQTSHETMPDLIIEADDRANIVAYILSLKD